MKSNRRRQQGQVFIEVLCGMILLGFMGLFALDLVVLVLANSANDTLAKNCARAAANTQSASAAKAAAVQVVKAFPTSPYVENVGFLGSKMVFEKDSVKTETVVVVKLPITLPGTVDKVAFHASSTEPLVGVTGAPDQKNLMAL